MPLRESTLAGEHASARERVHTRIHSSLGRNSPELGRATPLCPMRSPLSLTMLGLRQQADQVLTHAAGRSSPQTSGSQRRGAAREMPRTGEPGDQT